MQILFILISIFSVSAHPHDEEPDWNCESLDVITQKNGDICCHAGLVSVIEKVLQGTTSLQVAAEAVRGAVYRKFPGMWEVIVSDSDFGFANYVHETRHCKIRSSTGKFAMAWKIGDEPTPAPVTKKPDPVRIEIQVQEPNLQK